MTFTRYAIYYAPDDASDLARFGAAWLGWDNLAGAEVPHLDLPLPVADITEKPRKYGFHGTLKPPFRLNGGASESELADAVRGVAQIFPAIKVPQMKLKVIGSFIALAPVTVSRPLSDLASTCVMELDTFRAPPTEDELASRRAPGLTPEQETMLLRWGYPYVHDQFRFHLTLTGSLNTAMRTRVLSTLMPLADRYGRDLFPIKDIVLFGEREDGRFQKIARYALTG